LRERLPQRAQPFQGDRRDQEADGRAHGLSFVIAEPDSTAPKQSNLNRHGALRLAMTCYFAAARL
jgi:hypothetical protein